MRDTHWEFRGAEEFAPLVGAPATSDSCGAFYQSPNMILVSKSLTVSPNLPALRAISFRFRQPATASFRIFSWGLTPSDVALDLGNDGAALRITAATSMQAPSLMLTSDVNKWHNVAINFGPQSPPNECALQTFVDNNEPVVFVAKVLCPPTAPFTWLGASFGTTEIDEYAGWASNLDRLKIMQIFSAMTPN
jgi:hypothetical protein